MGGGARSLLFSPLLQGMCCPFKTNAVRVWTLNWLSPHIPLGIACAYLSTQMTPVVIYSLPGSHVQETVVSYRAQAPSLAAYT
jgi:hypothetical protein